MFFFLRLSFQTVDVFRLCFCEFCLKHWHVGDTAVTCYEIRVTGGAHSMSHKRLFNSTKKPWLGYIGDYPII